MTKSPIRLYMFLHLSWLGHHQWSTHLYTQLRISSTDLHIKGFWLLSGPVLVLNLCIPIPLNPNKKNSKALVIRLREVVVVLSKVVYPAACVCYSWFELCHMFVQSLFSVLRDNQWYYLYVVSTCYVINIPNLIQSEKRLTRLY